MTPEQLALLRAAANAAGSEEWWLDGCHDTVWGADGTSICKTFPNIGHHPEPVDERQLAEFIADANPATILALLDHIDQVRASTIEECAKMTRSVSGEPTTQSDSKYIQGYRTGVLCAASAIEGPRLNAAPNEEKS